MRRLIKISISIILIFLFSVVVPNSSAKSYKPIKKRILHLYECDLWGNRVSNSASGKLEFHLEGPDFEFKFKAKDLEPNLKYVLLRSLEPETLLPFQFEIIAEKISDGSGRLSIKGSYSFDLDLISAKFQLVPEYMLSLPIDGSPGPPGRYISGQGLIGYNDTDTELQSGCQSSGTNFDQLGISKGEKAIDFTLQSTEGDEFALYEFLIKPVVLIFGAYT